jgi:hypothetical protein
VGLYENWARALWLTQSISLHPTWEAIMLFILRWCQCRCWFIQVGGWEWSCRSSSYGYHGTQCWFIQGEVGNDHAIHPLMVPM